MPIARVAATTAATRDHQRCLRGGTRETALQAVTDSPFRLWQALSGAGPALVAAVRAGVELDQGAVGGAARDGVEAEARLDADDGSVGVEAPFLVVGAPAAVDLDPGAVARAAGVQALVAVDPELTGGGVRPLLVGAVVAVPQLELGAVGGTAAGHVQAAARPDALDRSGTRGGRGVAAVECVEDGG